MSGIPSPASEGLRLETLWPRSRPVVMGIVNCTPDSFSDGGRFPDPDAAILHGERLLDQGADMLDIGGESTRPGAERVSAKEELSRVEPVVAELRRRRSHCPISIDTTKAEVAARCLEVGADVVNDVSAASDPEMLPLVSSTDSGLILMHRRGTPQTMQHMLHYVDVVAEVHTFLHRRAQDALEAGVAPELVWLDPGIGFGKDDAGNIALIASLSDLSALGHPVVVGPSRKSFIGRLTGSAVADRLPGTLAALAPAVGLERAVVRVHEPGPVLQYLEIAVRLKEAIA